MSKSPKTSALSTRPAKPARVWSGKAFATTASTKGQEAQRGYPAPTIHWDPANKLERFSIAKKQNGTFAVADRLYAGYEVCWCSCKADADCVELALNFTEKYCT